MKCRGMDGEVERGVVFLNTICVRRGSVLRRVHDVCGVFMTGIFFCGMGGVRTPVFLSYSLFLPLPAP